MCQVEELPDDFNENLKLNGAPQGYSIEELDAGYARRFPRKDAHKSFEEVMSEISKTPLFMNDLDDAIDAGMPTPSTDGPSVS